MEKAHQQMNKSHFHDGNGFIFKKSFSLAGQEKSFHFHYLMEKAHHGNGNEFWT